MNHCPTEKPNQGEEHDMTLPERLVHEAIGSIYALFGQPNRNSGGDGKGRSCLTKALDLVQILPYAEYYAAYETGQAVNFIGKQFGSVGNVLAHEVNKELVPFEICGLVGNEALSVAILETNNGRANMYEGFYGRVLPSFVADNIPQVYLPGIHEDGKIDFAW
jgi:hypothetical protein